MHPFPNASPQSLHRHAPASPGKLLRVNLPSQYCPIPAQHQPRLALSPFYPQLIPSPASSLWNSPPQQPSPPPPSQQLPSKPPSLPVSLSPALPALPWHNQGGSFLSPCLPRCQHLLQPLSSKLWPLGRSRCRGARDALTTVSQVVHPGGCKESRAGSGGREPHTTELPPPRPPVLLTAPAP